MPLTRDQIEDFKAKNPTVDFRAVTIDEETVALIKRPDRMNWRAYRAMQDKQGALARLDSYEFIIRHATVCPTGPALDELITNQPGLVETLSGEIAEFAGSTNKSRAEKI